MRNLTFALSLLLHGLACALPAGQDIIEALGGQDGQRGTSEKIVAVTKVLDGVDVETKRFRVLDNDQGTSLVEFLDRLDRGTKILSTETDMWFLGSGSRRAIKIPPIQRAFGDASLGDVARLVLGRDYKLTEIADGTAPHDGTIQATLIAHSRAATYGKVVIWLTPPDLEPRQAHYFLASGKHGKTAVFSRNRRIGKSWHSDERLLSEPNASTRATRLTIESVSPRTVPESWFTQRHMEMDR